jgi:hypothetical protein
MLCRSVRVLVAITWAAVSASCCCPLEQLNLPVEGSLKGGTPTVTVGLTLKFATCCPNSMQREQALRIQKGVSDSFVLMVQNKKTPSDHQSIVDLARSSVNVVLQSCPIVEELRKDPEKLFSQDPGGRFVELAGWDPIPDPLSQEQVADRLDVFTLQRLEDAADEIELRNANAKS